MSVLQPSYCDPSRALPPGVGFTPPPGSRSYLYTLPNGRGVAASHLMDLGAHGFGDTHTYSMEAQRARYGPNFHGTDASLPRFLALDFESLFGVGSIHLSKLACAGRFGSHIPLTLSCYPTLEELHDFYACYPEEARAAAGTGGAPTSSRLPGIPVIISAGSGAPGVVNVLFRAARKGHNLYEVGVWETVLDAATDNLPPLISVPVAGSAIIAPGSEDLSVRIEIPPAMSRHLTIRVRAFLGGTAGRWSGVRAVEVLPPGTPVLPPTLPVASPPAPPSTTPPTAPPAGPDFLTRLRTAAEPVRLSLPDPGKGGLPLQRLAEKVRVLLAVIDAPTATSEGK